MLQVVFQRIHPDQVEQLRGWMSELMRRQVEVLETFRQEGMRHEVAYLLHAADGPVLVYAMEAEDMERAWAAYEASQLPIDLEHHRVLAAVQAGPREVEQLYELRLPPAPAT